MDFYRPVVNLFLCDVFVRSVFCERGLLIHVNAVFRAILSRASYRQSKYEYEVFHLITRICFYLEVLFRRSSVVIPGKKFRTRG